MTLFTCPWSSTSAGVTVMGISKKGIAVNGQRSAAGRAPWRPAAPTARTMLSPSSAIPSRVSTLVGSTSSRALPPAAAAPPAAAGAPRRARRPAARAAPPPAPARGGPAGGGGGGGGGGRGGEL